MEEKCFFCQRTSSDIRFMIHGPGDKCLCNNCISIVSIIANQAWLKMDDIDLKGDSWGEKDDSDEEYEGPFEHKKKWLLMRTNLLRVIIYQRRKKKKC